MPALLVSVQSANEARAALDGGAGFIDIKDPTRGALGRAEVGVWREVIAEVAGRAPVSVALGELNELDADATLEIPGLAFRKLGFAHTGQDWINRWAMVRSRAGSTRWVAVIYSDWQSCGAPSPDQVVDAAIQVEDCRGVLIDTFDKRQPTTVDPSWAPLFRQIQRSGRFVVLAGGLDLAAIERLAILRPNIFGVRGAACEGSRTGKVEESRVAALVAAIKRLGPGD